MKTRSTLVLLGDAVSLDQYREHIMVHVISPGIAQVMSPPFVTHRVAMRDIVTFDETYRITSVLIRNCRTFYGQISITGLAELGICRTTARLARFLGISLVDCSFMPMHFPGLFSMSVDIRMPLDNLWDLAERSPVKFRIIRRTDIVGL